MLLALQGTVEQVVPWFWMVFAVFLRIGAAMAVLPAFGEQFIPIRVRTGLAVALALSVWPLVPDPSVLVQTISAGTLVAETVSGLAIGLFFRLFVVALQLAGTIAAQSVSLSQVSGAGPTPDPSPAFVNLFVLAGLTLAIQDGLHVKLVVGLAESYKVLPFGDVPDGRALADWGVSGVNHLFSLGFSLAAPFVIASLLYNLALGVINRAMPQLMVAFVGVPAIAMGGLALLLLTLPVALGLWKMQFDAGLANPFGSLP